LQEKFAITSVEDDPDASRCAIEGSHFGSVVDEMLMKMRFDSNQATKE
jgi:hypothetical protein